MVAGIKELICSKPLTFEFNKYAVPFLQLWKVALRIKHLGVGYKDFHAFKDAQLFISHQGFLAHKVTIDRHISIPNLPVPSHLIVNSEGLSYDELASVKPLSKGVHLLCCTNIEKDEFKLMIRAG